MKPLVETRESLDTPRERIRSALEGGKPDGVPIFPIYDLGYIIRCSGQDERAWKTASGAERIADAGRGGACDQLRRLEPHRVRKAQRREVAWR